MQVIVKKNGKDKMSIGIEGDMTIYSVKELKNELLKYFKSIKNTEFDLSKINSIDTSGFQLLAMIRKELIKNNKKFNIINPSKDVVRIFQLYGENL